MVVELYTFINNHWTIYYNKIGDCYSIYLFCFKAGTKWDLEALSEMELFSSSNDSE